MAFPFQCLIARNSSSASSGDWTLFGASGSKLFAQSSSGTTSTWPPQNDTIRDDQDEELEERPGKRVKLSPQAQTQTSNFSQLILSSDGRHMVAVTGEDKCIRVFQIDGQCRLTQLSERCMPRRPSAIALASDDSTILCGDKFGDVYALPLLPGPNDMQLAAPIAKEPEPEKEFTPSATVLTVHSGRNRKTLEDQLKQKAKPAPKTKEVATFRHDLLLGHVSMLTDLVYAKMDNHGYIVTADRDEHIRISRGPPQAHIIEGFCFGHEEFVSRLCLTKSGLLVSGGGDNHIYVWDWKKHQLQNKLPLRDHALQHMQSRTKLSPSAADEANFRVAVSGIWDAPSGADVTDKIIVACEGLPVLFAFDVNAGESGCTEIPLSGNALDVAFVKTAETSWTLAVSIDNIHVPGSTTEAQKDQVTPRVQYFSIQVDGQWRENSSVQETLEWFVQHGSEIQGDGSHAGDVQEGDATGSGPKDDKAARDILYSIENLRKRAGGAEE